jgi:hypothetical protein
VPTPRIVPIAIIAALGLLAGCGSATPAAGPTVTVTATATVTGQASAPTPTTTPAGPPGCATSGLTVSLGQGGAAAGSAFYPIEFTNTSSSTCSLYGYPGVSFVSSAGHQVGAAATEDPTYPRRLVTLAPGAAAHASLRVVDALNYPTANCHPVTVAKLKVYPPNQTTFLYLSLPSTACSLTSVQILSVQTVQPGNGSS